jgi:polyisoprenyl-teichoic acid--peptidoglycan teichoic acid transferase
MNRIVTRIVLFLSLASLVAGCASPSLLSAPASVMAQAEASATPEIVLAPPDTAPTPTPFRPIPPTPVYLPTGTPTPTPEPTATPTPTSVVDAYLAPEQYEQLPGRVNILLLGMDQRPWQKGKRYRTDTIILATLNKEAGTLTLTSFPRDLFINIPGHGQDRINTAWEYGGWELLQQTFKENFGLRPDHFVLINFFNFKQFVDELEGLEVNVGQELSDYRNGYWTTIPKGPIYMDADMVLWYVRSRKTSNDFARNKRQQEVLLAIMQEVIDVKNVPRIPELYDIYKGMVITDMSLDDFLPLVPIALKLTEGDRVNSNYIGPKVVSDYITPAGAMVLLPDMDAIRRIIRKSQNSQSEDSP